MGSIIRAISSDWRRFVTLPSNAMVERRGLDGWVKRGEARFAEYGYVGRAKSAGRARSAGRRVAVTLETHGPWRCYLK